jgi:outer membrane protein assembly factor BamD
MSQRRGGHLNALIFKMKRHLKLVLALTFLTLGAAILSSCSSSSKGTPTLQENFAKAKALYDKKDYTAAQLEFAKLAYVTRATELEGDVAYYQAQCYFYDEQYLLALDGYQQILRNLPNTPYLKDATFQQAMCLFKLSPPYALDQDYTKQAVQQFQIFIDYYPTSDSVKIADANIKICRNKLAHKDVENAGLYFKLRAYKAATIYYTNVIENFIDTDYFESALLGRIAAYIERSRWADAKADIEFYKEKFPDKVAAIQSYKNIVSKNLREAELKK